MSMKVSVNQNDFWTINENGYFEFTSNLGILLPSGNTAQRPTGVLGVIRFNTQTNALEVWNGGWSTIIDSSSSSIFVLKAGDTMTGPLVLSGAPTLGGHATTKDYVDNLVSNTRTASVALAGTTAIGTAVPINTKIVRVDVNITGAYNGGTTLSIGDIADNNRLVATTDIVPTLGENYSFYLNYNYTISRQLNVYLTGASSGSAEVIVYSTPY